MVTASHPVAVVTFHCSSAGVGDTLRARACCRGYIHLRERGIGEGNGEWGTGNGERSPISIKAGTFPGNVPSFSKDFS